MFKRLGNLVRGFFGLFVSGLERQNPEALIEVETENLRKQISEYNKGLAAHAGLCERLMSQVKKQEKESAELRAKTAAYLKTGNKKLAGQFALRLQSVKKDLEENRLQLEDAETTYKELLRARDVSVKAARDKIEGLKRSISDMKMKTAIADLNEMAAGMIGEIGGDGDTLNRLEQIVDEERDKAAGRARVARDSLDVTDIVAIEAEQGAMEEMALADFAAAEGLVMEGGDSSGGGGEAVEGGESEGAAREM
jgi:phage shock protein A